MRFPWQQSTKINEGTAAKHEALITELLGQSSQQRIDINQLTVRVNAINLRLSGIEQMLRNTSVSTNDNLEKIDSAVGKLEDVAKEHDRRIRDLEG